MERDGFFKDPIEFYFGHIPFIITDLITQLIKIKGQNSRMLFNKELTDANLEKLIAELKTKRISNWSDYNNPANLSVCLLLYIDSLFHDEPLITEDVQEFLLSHQFTDSQSNLKLLRKVLLKLYIGRFQTLSYLINFLSQSYFISEDQLFNLFSIPFFGEKSISINKIILKDLFQIILRNYCTIFQNSVSKEAFLTDEQIDLLMQKHYEGETVKFCHKVGNLTTDKIGQNELKHFMNDSQKNILTDKITQSKHNERMKKKFNHTSSDESIDLTQKYIPSNISHIDMFIQTDEKQNKKFSFSNNMIIFKLKPKNKKAKKTISDSNQIIANKDKSNSKSCSKKNVNNLSNHKKVSLQINQPFIVEALRHQIRNYSLNDDILESDSLSHSSSKTNSQTISSSATSSTTSSYSFYSYSRLEANLSKYGQESEPTLQIKNIIQDPNDNNMTKINKTIPKAKKTKKNNNLKDRSDTSDNVSNSDNATNNYEKIPKPPLIFDYLNSTGRRKKTNYAKNHNYTNNYFYADNSSENNNNNYSENRDNDKSDSQNGIEVKFDFYKNLVSSNINEVLPPAPMLDPELLSSPIFSNDFNPNYNQDNYLSIKKEVPSLTVYDQISTGNKIDDENSKHVSFHLQSGSSSVKSNDDNNNKNNSENSNSYFKDIIIDEYESSLASSCKREEEDKKEDNDEETETKKGDEEKNKKSSIYKYFKKKKEKKKKDEKKAKKEKLIDDEKKPKVDRTDKNDKHEKIEKTFKKEKKDKIDKKPKKK